MCSCRNPDIKDGVNITHLLRCSQRKQVATSPLVSPQNDVCGTTAEIPYWWSVTTHIWVVLLIGCAAREICNQKHYPDLDSDVSSEWNFCARSSDVISQGNSSVVAKYRLFSWAGSVLASHTGVFRGARLSSLPTNACSTENNISFPLFYLHGKWPAINSREMKCWQAKHD